MLAVVAGVVHPVYGGWQFDQALEVPFTDGKWTVSFKQSQFHVFIDGDHPGDYGAFLNEVGSIVQGCLDALGFHLAMPLRAEIMSMVIDGYQLIYRTPQWPELLSDPTRAGVPESELQPYVAAAIEEPLARLALADLRTAIDSPDDTLFLCYRATESVRQWFLTGNQDDGDARKKSWRTMREALGVAEPVTRRLESAAMSRRHGAASPPSADERREIALLARDVVARFVTYLNARRTDKS